MNTHSIYVLLVGNMKTVLSLLVAFIFFSILYIKVFNKNQT